MKKLRKLEKKPEVDEKDMKDIKDSLISHKTISSSTFNESNQIQKYLNCKITSSQLLNSNLLDNYYSSSEN